MGLWVTHAVLGGYLVSNSGERCTMWTLNRCALCVVLKQVKQYLFKFSKRSAYLFGGCAFEASKMHWQKFFKTTSTIWGWEGEKTSKSVIWITNAHKEQTANGENKSGFQPILASGALAMKACQSSVGWYSFPKSHQEDQEKWSSACWRSLTGEPTYLMEHYGQH